MKKLIKIISTQEPEVLQIRYFPTDICNYNCSYCFPGSGNVNKFRYPTNIDLLIKNFSVILDFYKNNLGKNKFHLQLAGGGEPLLWPEINIFCKALKEKFDIRITLITNGSRTTRWWEENFECFDEVALSCHHEFVKLNHFVAVADLLYKKGINVFAQVLMDARYFEKCKQNIEYMMTYSKTSFYIQTKEIIDAPGMGMDVYTEEQLQYLQNSSKRLPDKEKIINMLETKKIYESALFFDDDSMILASAGTVIVNKLNKFKAWSCNVGMESLVINADGGVRGSCQEPLFSNMNFNLYSSTFESDFLNAKIKIGAITCIRDECTCTTETHITKKIKLI